MQIWKSLINKKDCVYSCSIFILTVQSSKLINGISSLCWEFIKISSFKILLWSYISNLSKNHINTVGTCFTLEEIIQDFNSIAFDHKKNILSQHFSARAPKMVGMKYS